MVERYPGARLVHQETNSDLWRWLGWARSRSLDLTVFVTDGDLGDRLTPELRAVLATSGPTLFLDVLAATAWSVVSSFNNVLQKCSPGDPEADDALNEAMDLCMMVDQWGLEGNEEFDAAVEALCGLSGGGGPF